MINSGLKKLNKEFLFQFVLILVLGIATAVEKHEAALDLFLSVSKLSFFLSYTLAALFIGYVLLPRFFYKKKYWLFTIGVFLVLFTVIGVEELILEQIFYPNSRGKNFPGFIHTLLEILPTILILVGFKFAWDAQQKQSELEQLNNAMAESRMQFLKSQINPHFLFNNLNNLYAYALEQSPKTPTIILELSSLLRYMLYDCQEKLVPLEKEIKSLKDFIHLQELQIEDRGDIQFTVSGQTIGWSIAPLILVVFIENCFKHSTSSQTDEIQIDIDITIKNNQLVMECNNTFSSNTNTQKLSKGIGLENVQARLDLLYPNAHQLDIKAEENIYKVKLELNLVTSKELSSS